jgi:uncharacterized protein (TIGR02391 family)
MLKWFITINSILREMRKKAMDCQYHLSNDDEAAANTLNGYLKTDYKSLSLAWEEAGFDKNELGSLGRHIGFGQNHDYNDILERDIPDVEAHAERHARAGERTPDAIGFEDLLHSIVRKHALKQYQDGHLRDAVLNSIVAVFDLIRERSNLKQDGQALVTEAFSIEKPHLIFSELDSESGRNDQKGFMQILIGAYIGVRNPKAHSLFHDLDHAKAAQYLIFASLLARRITEATVTNH